MVLTAEEFETYQVKSGDKVIMTFTVTGTWPETRVVEVIEELNRDPRWVVDFWRRPSESELEVHLIVVENPFVVGAIIVAVTVIAGGLFLYMTVSKVEVISREAPLAMAGAGIGILAAVGGFLYLMWR